MKIFKKKKEVTQQSIKETPQEKEPKIPIEETEEYKQNNCIT